MKSSSERRRILRHISEVFVIVNLKCHCKRVKALELIYSCALPRYTDNAVSVINCSSLCSLGY